MQELKAAGADLRIGDITEAPEKTEAFLLGVDILVSLVPAMIDQKPLLLAAKKVGVGRVVPSDFGTHAPRGVMTIHDIVNVIRLLDYRHNLIIRTETGRPGLHQGDRVALYLHRSRLVATMAVPFPACHAGKCRHYQDLRWRPSDESVIHRTQLDWYFRRAHPRRPAHAQPDGYHARWRGNFE